MDKSKINLERQQYSKSSLKGVLRIGLSENNNATMNIL
jgi:hypothetical protein